MSEIKFYRLDKDVEYNDSPLRIPAGTIVVTAIAHAEAMNALQARLAQCEREREQEAHGRKLYSDELNRAKNRICQEAGIDPERGYEAGITALKAERIAELERSAQIEEGE